jgi:hypothetical protein
MAGESAPYSTHRNTIGRIRRTCESRFHSLISNGGLATFSNAIRDTCHSHRFAGREPTGHVGTNGRSAAIR